MDASTNLKRRRDSGDSITEGEEKKKQCKNKNMPPKTIPQPCANYTNTTLTCHTISFL